MGTFRGEGLEALVFVRLPGLGFDHFERFLTGESDVLAAWHVVGDVDLVAHVRCADLTAVEALVDRMRADGLATGTSVHLILRESSILRETSLPAASGADGGPVVRPARHLAVAG